MHVGKILIKEFGCSIMQPDSILSNVEATKIFVENNLEMKTSTDSFWDTIKILQHNDLANISHIQDEPEIVWYDNETIIFKNALKNLIGNEEIPGDANYLNSERKYFEEKYHNAISQFKVTFPETFDCFKKVISFIIFGKRPGYSGGTVSNRIGLIWLAPDRNWKDVEWLENLIHEFTHNILFLDDMVNGIFVEGGKRLEEKDALATSAIRQVKRGYDKSYHSAFVSFNIIEHYLKINKQNLTEKFIDPLIICLEDLVNNTEFITEHGRQVLFELAGLVLRTREKYFDQS